MAFDKVVDSAFLDGGLKKIADAIREKSGSADALAFPDEMEAAVKAIETGGSGGGMATGTLTFAEETSTSLATTVNHNLGYVPSNILWFVEESTSVNSSGYLQGGRIGAFEYNTKNHYILVTSLSSGVGANVYYMIRSNNIYDKCGATETDIKIFYYHNSRVTAKVPSGSTIRWMVW